MIDRMFKMTIQLIDIQFILAIVLIINGFADVHRKYQLKELERKIQKIEQTQNTGECQCLN
jgi:hypothetical protein